MKLLETPKPPPQIDANFDLAAFKLELKEFFEEKKEFSIDFYAMRLTKYRAMVSKENEFQESMSTLIKEMIAESDNR